MNDDYVREVKIKEKTEKQKEIELIKHIIKTREALKNANVNFEFANDDLVDYYAYEIKANQAKLDYLIRRAKEQGVEVDMVKDLEYSTWEEEAV